MLLDHPGLFLAKPVKWAVQKGQQSASVSLYISYIIYTEYPPGEPEIDLSERALEMSGLMNVMKRDGNYNEGQFKVLTCILGWDGDWETFGVDAQGVLRWHPPECRVTVEEHEYEGKKSLRVNRVERADGCPLGSTAEDLAELNRTYPAMRAKAAALRAGKPIPNPPEVPWDDRPPPTPETIAFDKAAKAVLDCLRSGQPPTGDQIPF